VAYRYFATPARKFIIADTPGHIQYTRNMVTGNSTADLTIVLVDARNGIVEQTRRHAFLASLLRVPHLLVCVNKMDLVDFDQEVFDSIREEFTAFASRLEVADMTFIPISALQGDNVVQRSANMPWYEGASLLHHLEQVYISSDRNLIDPRLPVQWVVRPQATSRPDYRGYAGRIEGGVFRPGDEVMVLPSGLTTTVAGIDTFEGPQDEAFTPMSITMRLTDDIDVSRGDMICRPHNRPTVGQDLDAMLCWMTERPVKVGDFLALKHTTRWVRAVVRDIHYRMDVNTLHRDEAATSLGLNDVGRVSLRVTQPLFYDSYRRNRRTGSFILAAEDTNVTAGAGMLLGPD
jgi:bifunctional enzyme CysN/CysC